MQGTAAAARRRTSVNNRSRGVKDYGAHHKARQ
jgi:hypothetical protein